jgi:2-amino-4-hydroxy-6-hydroxymethyldihydropteridine diphosphokinase
VRLEAEGVIILARSPWYETAPVPLSDQPWFVNGVADVTTTLGAVKLLDLLHRIEGEFGRNRAGVNEARSLDLDLLAYGDLVWQESAPLLPHPRLCQRAFVLLPLKDLAPSWRHPATRLTLEEMIRDMPPGQEIRRQIP